MGKNQNQDEMKGVLNGNQLALIDTFKPCIISPHDVRNPVHIGQASGDTRMGERFLTRVRQMDEMSFLFLDHLYGLLGAYNGTNTTTLAVIVVDLHLSRDLVPRDA